MRTRIITAFQKTFGHSEKSIFNTLKLINSIIFFKKLIGAHSCSALTSIPLSSLSGPRLKCRTKSGGVQCGKKNDFRADQLLTPPTPPPYPTPPPQLRACIESLGMQFIWIASAEAEWSMVGPWLGWGGVKCEARSAECPPDPRWPRVRVCVHERNVIQQSLQVERMCGSVSVCVNVWYCSMFCCVSKYLGCVCVKGCWACVLGCWVGDRD